MYLPRVGYNWGGANGEAAGIVAVAAVAEIEVVGIVAAVGVTT